ncbi:FAD-dependent monooxygenase [Ideonella sp. A 288]|uniref:FAD-dependent monooxygenase n=1 Tax=Ideonella sp. A 288 TaxID=1962181 RepID=UPI000B4B82D9|nr:FAD-dependent monooxygenase [Ideonella sp. A 288]
MGMDIVIVGAGLGGLTVAAALLHSGHRVRVFEQSRRLGEVGAGIQMSANAMKVLDSLGLRPALEPLSVRPKAFEFRRYDTGEMLHRLPLGDLHEQRHGAPYLQMHRADLHDALQRLVRALDPRAITLGARATAIDEGVDDVTVHFDGLPSVHASLVVGADGIKSVVRRHILGDDLPVFTGQVAWRCTVPTARIPHALRTDLVSTIWCGPHNHAVTYYLRGGELLNFVGCVERPWEEESWAARRPWSELDTDYRGWHPMVRAVIEHADSDQCYRWALNNRAPSMRWSSSRVTLLGDAVHATLPYMAQGAAMAIEDAAVLARALALPGPLDARLARYEIHRAPRTARVVRESTEMGELYHIGDAQTMRQAFVDRDIARSRNEWLYPYDPLRVEIG